jgi:hypothetical protein
MKRKSSRGKEKRQKKLTEILVVKELFNADISKNVPTSLEKQDRLLLQPGCDSSTTSKIVTASNPNHSH